MKQPKDMNLEELKSLAYDMIVGREKLGNDLQVINQLIINKSNENKEVKEEVKEEVEQEVL